MSHKMSHKAGADAGIDYGDVAAFLLWLAVAIVLVIVFAAKAVH